jgi:transcriptional regulator of NAD metabolism
MKGNIMKADERRQAIADYLQTKEVAVPGATLSREFGVSRQIIVQDISALKASGYDITPTHFGYVMHKAPHAERVFKTYHSTEETRDELSLIVSLGGTVINVFVWHKVYGKLEARLGISTHEDIDRFIEGVRSGTSVELMHITGGHHFHTVRAQSEEILDRIEAKMNAMGYIEK